MRILKGTVTVLFGLLIVAIAGGLAGWSVSALLGLMTGEPQSDVRSAITGAVVFLAPILCLALIASITAVRRKHTNQSQDN